MAAEDALSESKGKAIVDAFLGKMDIGIAQICPQNKWALTADRAASLLKENPEIEFQLHANVRLFEIQRRPIDLSTDDSAYWHQLKEINDLLNGRQYSAHAGKRCEASLIKTFENTKRLEDYLGIPVAIEGHYPTKDSTFLMDSWEEYAQLLKNDVHYAIDLSHIHILFRKTRHCDRELLKDILANDRCIEIHLSANNGFEDEHIEITREPWWWDVFQERNKNATIFYEGAQKK